ncbi:MAG TPA: crosslink repair DNA glycosylase YcaQ family protein, partial [Acidimicrobiia bacterium]|nr:crosslink repair DNA glycosylase YcaQ family protein [Acidimicrobiia bacterium]
TLRAARYNDRRFLDTGVTPREADSLLPHLAEYLSEPRSKDEIEAVVGDRLSAPEAASWVWWALRQVGSFWHAPSSDPWSFGRRPTYVSTRLQESEGREDPVQGLVRRYLSGFGPASAQDVAQFALLRQSTLRPALSEMSDLVELEGPDGRVLMDVSDGLIPDEDTPSPPRLMAMWDSTLLAHKDRSRIIPDRFRKLVIRPNGDVLPTVLIDGYVAGVWRPVDDGIEVTAFDTVDDETWEELAHEARRLLGMLVERDPRTYSRYDRWWAEMPDGMVRVLP